MDTSRGRKIAEVAILEILSPQLRSVYVVDKLNIHSVVGVKVSLYKLFGHLIRVNSLFISLQLLKQLSFSLEAFNTELYLQVVIMFKPFIPLLLLHLAHNVINNPLRHSNCPVCILQCTLKLSLECEGAAYV